MKSFRNQATPGRHVEWRPERIHDAYKAEEKLPEPTVCSDCGAVYRDGRWTWRSADPHAHGTRCPACRRIADRFPAGYLTIGGAFYARHREEILNALRNCEAAEKAEHPMERIMAIDENADGDGATVTTTSPHVARRMADALHDAWRGSLDLHYDEAQDLFRARWTRDR